VNSFFLKLFKLRGNELSDSDKAIPQLVNGDNTVGSDDLHRRTGHSTDGAICGDADKLETRLAFKIRDKFISMLYSRQSVTSDCHHIFQPVSELCSEKRMA
jgi:hypothetical protein